MMVDSHLRKQVLECFQLLGNCTELHKKDGGVYALAHENHPLSKWTMANKTNAAYVYKFAVSTSIEVTHRFGTSLYDSYPFDEALAYVSDYLYTEPQLYPFCMPEDLRARLLPGYELGHTPRLHPSLDVVVKAYRAYYCMYKSREMQSFQWTNRPMPYWWLEYCDKVGRVPF